MSGAAPAEGGERTRYRLRVCFSKTGRLRYISHLDFIRAFERAVRRSGLPVAYTEGFSPAPRIAYGWPLPVGTAGLAEYLDIELMERVDPGEAVVRLGRALPRGLEVRDARYVSPRGPALMVEFDTASYLVRVPSGLRGPEEWRGAVERLLARPTLEVTREKEPAGSPGKGRRARVVDLRPLVRRLRVRGAEDGWVTLFMELALSEKGTARPEEVAGLLREAVGEGPAEPGSVTAVRLGLRREAPPRG